MKSNSNNMASQPRNESNEPVANLAMEYCELLREHGKELTGHTVQDYLARLQPSLQEEFLELINLDLLVQAVEGSLVEEVQQQVVELGGDSPAPGGPSSSVVRENGGEEAAPREPAPPLPVMGDPPVQLPCMLR